jgi:hypothetical protein
MASTVRLVRQCVTVWRSAHTAALITSHTAKITIAAAASASAILISALPSLARSHTTTPSAAPPASSRTVEYVAIIDHP